MDPEICLYSPFLKLCTLLSAKPFDLGDRLGVVKCLIPFTLQNVLNCCDTKHWA